jgi:sugar lactone lactonase YvrE
MPRLVVVLVALALALLALAAQPASADRGVVRFATLPTGEPGHPEGIAADDSGNIYAASFDPNGGVHNRIYVFAPSGTLIDTIDLTGHDPLGMQFGPDGKLYVDDFGNGTVLQLAPPSHTITNMYQVCGGPGAGCALNAIAFDASGLLYTSDSFGGNIYTVNTTTGTVALFVSDERLKPAPAPHGFPPFGANGLAFKGSDLYVANTADDRVLKITAAKAISTFVESVNGADGIGFDSAGRLWVCANQENTLYVLDANGLVADMIGSFEGIDPDGTPRGLLFPASIVQSRGSMYVTNTALDFRHHFVGETPVTTFTLSRVSLGPSGR